MPDVTRCQQPKPLDEVRTALRLRYYSIHTECFSKEFFLLLPPRLQSLAHRGSRHDFQPYAVRALKEDRIVPGMLFRTPLGFAYHDPRGS